MTRRVCSVDVGHIHLGGNTPTLHNQINLCVALFLVRAMCNWQEVTAIGRKSLLVPHSFRVGGKKGFRGWPYKQLFESLFGKIWTDNRAKLSEKKNKNQQLTNVHSFWNGLISPCPRAFWVRSSCLVSLSITHIPKAGKLERGLIFYKSSIFRPQSIHSNSINKRWSYKKLKLLLMLMCTHLCALLWMDDCLDKMRLLKLLNRRCIW